MTRLELLDRLPLLRREMFIRHSVPVGPRVKKNPDGKMCWVRSVHIQSHPLWLIVITHWPEKTFRTRVYLRYTDDSLLSLEDKGGFHTLLGAEWAAFKALRSVIEDVQVVRDTEVMEVINQ